MIYTIRRSFLIWLTIAFAQVVIVTPAFGQMQGAATYSDSWGDVYNIYGSGTTDSSYNSYNHEFRAVTTLASPNGRMSSQDTGYSSYATAYVALSFDQNDLGLYTVETEHYDYCPIVFQEVYVGYTYASAEAGTSQAIYKNDFCTVSSTSPLVLYCEWVPIPGCSVKCMPAPITTHPTIPPDLAPIAESRIVRLQFWIAAGGYHFCIPSNTEIIYAHTGIPLTCEDQ